MSPITFTTGRPYPLSYPAHTTDKGNKVYYTGVYELLTEWNGLLIFLNRDTGVDVRLSREDAERAVKESLYSLRLCPTTARNKWLKSNRQYD